MEMGGKARGELGWYWVKSQNCKEYIYNVLWDLNLCKLYAHTHILRTVKGFSSDSFFWPLFLVSCSLNPGHRPTSIFNNIRTTVPSPCVTPVQRFSPDVSFSDYRKLEVAIAAGVSRIVRKNVTFLPAFVQRSFLSAIFHILGIKFAV